MVSTAATECVIRTTHTFADEATRESVDAKCRKLTAPWVRERAATVPDIELCGFYEEHEKAGDDALLPPGVYTLQDLRQFGRKKGFCPYFLARRMIVHANVVVYNYQYMLDPKVSQMVRALRGGRRACAECCCVSS